jgi:hypothetical protein
MSGFVDWAIRSGERAATDDVDAPPAAVAVRVDQSPVATAQIAQIAQTSSSGSISTPRKSKPSSLRTPQRCPACD